MLQTRRTAQRPIFKSALYLQKPVPSHRQHVVSFITLLQERQSYNCRQVMTFILHFVLGSMASKEKVRNYYTAHFKLKVVKIAEENSKLKASKVFGVHRKRVQVWCQQKEELKKLPSNAKMLPARGCKVSYPDIEEKTF